MYEFDMTDPEEVKRLQSVIESAVESVTTHLTRLQSEPVEYSHEYGWTGAGNDQLFKPIMKGLNLETTEILKSEKGTGRKTEWLGTTNPNIIVLTEYGSPEGNGKNWQMTNREIGVVNNAWLKAEFSPTK